MTKRSYKVWSRPAGYTVENIDGRAPYYVSKPFASKDLAQKHRDDLEQQRDA